MAYGRDQKLLYAASCFACLSAYSLPAGVCIFSLERKYKKNHIVISWSLTHLMKCFFVSGQALI